MNRIEFYSKLDKYKADKANEEKEQNGGSLSHYGIIGQKWGTRRWQNADGTFNTEGKIRYFSKNSTAKKNKEEKPAGKNDKDQKIGKIEGIPYRMNNGNMYHLEYQNTDGSLTKKGERALRRAKKYPKFFITKNLIDEDFYEKWKNGENKTSEENTNEEVQNRINEIKSSYKIDKNLSGDKITVKEFKDIIDELNNFNKGDFERNHREEYNKVADMGIDALNKAEGEEYDVGDDNTRMWFMWEDQTDGLGEIAYLRSKGYSKDYVKQYLESPLPEEIEEIREKNHYATPFFVRNEFYRGGDDYIDALYDDGSQDQKIGATGIYDIAAGVISVKNAINNYDDVQALRSEYSDFMKNSDQNYSDDERLSVLNNKKKIAKMQNALEFGDEKAYNKLLGKVKGKDKEAVEKFLKDLNQKNNELSKPDEDTAKKLEDSVFDERVGSLSKPKISRQYLKPDGTLNETGKRRTASNRKVSDVASSVFLALRNFKLFELASLPVAGAALALSGFGVPAVLATALAGAIVAPSAAIDNTLYKKLEKRADAYYDMLNK